VRRCLALRCGIGASWHRCVAPHCVVPSVRCGVVALHRIASWHRCMATHCAVASVRRGVVALHRIASWHRCMATHCVGVEHARPLRNAAPHIAVHCRPLPYIAHGARCGRVTIKKACGPHAAGPARTALHTRRRSEGNGIRPNWRRHSFAKQKPGAEPEQTSGYGAPLAKSTKR